MMTQFEKDTVEGLSTIKETLMGIKDHLATLNGKVAAHEKAIGEIMLANAERVQQCPVVDELRKEIQTELKFLHDYVVADTAQSKFTTKLMQWTKPLITVFLAALAFLFGQHAEGLKTYFMK